MNWKSVDFVITFAFIGCILINSGCHCFGVAEPLKNEGYGEGIWGLGHVYHLTVIIKCLAE